MTKADKPSDRAQERRRRGASGDDVYEALYDALLKGELAPGDRVRETEIAERFGVSRTPAREAMQRLETQGLLVVEPRKGASIRRLDQQAVTELYLLRGVLEGMAAAEAARHASEAEVETLAAMLAEPPPAPTDATALTRRNKAFHQAIHRAAHNRFLLETMINLSASFALLGRTTLVAEARADEAEEEHRRIFEAIAAGRAADARTAMEAHIHRSHQARLRLMAAEDPRA